MRVLVTGGAGFIGVHTVRALVRAGHSVRVLDSLEPPVHTSRTRPYELLEHGVDFVLGSVTDPQAVAWALEDVEGVIHLAAYQDYLPDWSKFMNVNVGGLALLCETIAARKLPIDRIVIASSQAVYGEGDGRCPLKESDECHPISIYGVSKLAGELLANRLHDLYGLPIVLLRYSITQGAGQSPHNAYSGILRSFAQRLMAGLPPLVYEDGLQTRDYVWVGDVANVNVMALTDCRMMGRTFNVGGDTVASASGYARLVCERMDSLIPAVITGEHRVGDVRDALSDSSQLKALGWKQTKTLPEIVDEYLDWLRGQPLDEATQAAYFRMKQLDVLR